MRRLHHSRRAWGTGLALAFWAASAAWSQPFPACDMPDPGAGDCLTPTPGIGGCDDAECCNLVCEQDIFCCTGEWDSNCVDTAEDVCVLAVNDDCVDAAPISLGQFVAFTTIPATTDGVEELVCLPQGAFQIHNDIWYTFTPPASGAFRASVCGSDFDTVLAVYQGCVTCPPSNAIGCSNNDCFKASELDFEGTVGQCYLIRVGGQAQTDRGEGVMSITTTTPPPPNDDCDDHIDLAMPSVVQGSTVTATSDPTAPSPCDVAVTAPGVWYSVIGTGTEITISTCSMSTNYDTRVNVYCNTCMELVCVGGNDNQLGPFDPSCDTLGFGTNRGSTFSWCSELGTEYLILVQGTAGDIGSFELAVSDDGVACAPAPSCEVVVAPPNDDCADAAPVTLGDTPFTTIGAATDGPPHAACAGNSADPQVSRDVWFVYDAGFTGDLLVSTCGLVDFDSRIAVYNDTDCGDLDDLSLISCNDDDPFNPCGGFPTFHSATVVQVTGGQSYLIRVGGFGIAEGSGTLRLTAGSPNPACPGSGECHVPNGTPGCADPECCNIVCLARPACCDVAWDQACADAALEVCGAPPVCAILDGFCQRPDQLGHGTGGLLAVPSDSNPGADSLVADNFTADFDDMVTEVCWWGLYADLVSTPPGDCGPGGGDQFSVTYYANSTGAPDFPGAAIAGPFALAPEKAVTGNVMPSAIGPLTEYQYTATHPEVPVVAGTRYWIQIANLTGGNCTWFWSTAPGDALAHRQTPIGGGYSSATATDYDMAFCLDLEQLDCPWDCDGSADGVVGTADLLATLSQWGRAGVSCDTDGAGIGTSDLLALLGNWGLCPGTPPPCPWDCGTPSDGLIGTNDLLVVLAQWGMVGSACDVDGGGVGTSDLLEILSNWGECP